MSDTDWSKLAEVEFRALVALHNKDVTAAVGFTKHIWDSLWDGILQYKIPMSSLSDEEVAKILCRKDNDVEKFFKAHPGTVITMIQSMRSVGLDS